MILSSVYQMHCSGLAWHPDVATQMVLASEDDKLPVIQMWDLRFASSPFRVLENHTRYSCPVVYTSWVQNSNAVMVCGLCLSHLNLGVS